MKHPTLLVSCKGKKKLLFLPPHYAAAVIFLKLHYSALQREQGEEESLLGSIAALLQAAVNIAACSTLLSHCKTSGQQHFVLATGIWVSAPSATGLQVPSSKNDLQERFPSPVPSNIKMHQVFRMVFGSRSMNLFLNLVLQRPHKGNLCLPFSY